MPTTASATSSLPLLQLPVPRHLQECDGYCGPASLMMLLSMLQPNQTYDQQALYQEILKRTLEETEWYSTPDSIITVLNTYPGQSWKKAFHPDSSNGTSPNGAAAMICESIEVHRKPCMLAIREGAHWVVAFGRNLKTNGSVAGLWIRDPAWVDWPNFFGREKFTHPPTFNHTQGLTCSCTNKATTKPSIHETYMTMNELLSTRGLYGADDNINGIGSIAIVPQIVSGPAANHPSTPGVKPLALGRERRGDGRGRDDKEDGTPRTSPGAAAMNALREHGLVGRADSPPDWVAALNAGVPENPILVKSPDRPEDDFLLIRVAPNNPAATYVAWVILDAVTLEMRETSLLDRWSTPMFPTPNDLKTIVDSNMPLSKPQAKLKLSDLTPNMTNFVWKPNAQAIMPYWPMKEVTAIDPSNGKPISIFLSPSANPSTPPKVHTSLPKYGVAVSGKKVPWWQMVIDLIKKNK